MWYAPARSNHTYLQQWGTGRVMVGKLTLLKPYAFFDTNGTILNPESALFEYRWGASRVSELLPVDHEPMQEITVCFKRNQLIKILSYVDS